MSVKGRKRALFHSNSVAVLPNVAMDKDVQGNRNRDVFEKFTSTSSSLPGSLFKKKKRTSSSPSFSTTSPSPSLYSSIKTGKNRIRERRHPQKRKQSIKARKLKRGKAKTPSSYSLSTPHSISSSSSSSLSRKNKKKSTTCCTKRVNTKQRVSSKTSTAKALKLFMPAVNRTTLTTEYILYQR